jgi:hypothetical protein
MAKMNMILITAVLLAHSAPARTQPLTLYPMANHKGLSTRLNTGRYSGDLGEFDNQAVSFKLQPNHIATFAENANGSGHSRVYIAAEEAISINLPPALQKTVSFIRVGPWSNVRKKSACAAGSEIHEMAKTSWYYNWGSKATSPSSETFEYVPMTWSGDKIWGVNAIGNRMDVSHHLGFNEPDGKDQANMTVDNAIVKFEILQASGLRLGSPAPKDNASGREWLDEFMGKALDAGLRVDFITVHYYKKSTPDGFYRWLKYLHDKYNLPVWVSEFNYGASWNWNATPEKEFEKGLEAYMEMLDKTPFVERYSIFNWNPPSPFSLFSCKEPLQLSAAGKAYVKHVSPPAYTPEHYVSIPWTDNPIGRFYPVSKASYLDKDRTFTLQSAGRGVSGSDDQFHYVHQPVMADASISAGIKKIEGSSPELTAGVMIRETQEPGSKFIMMALNSDHEAVLYYRSETGADAQQLDAKKLRGDFVKLVRKDNQFTGFVSKNGKSWKTVDRVEIDMGVQTSCGLCLTSSEPGALSTAIFEDVIVSEEK